jgi:hypothetical protein
MHDVHVKQQTTDASRVASPSLPMPSTMEVHEYSAATLALWAMHAKQLQVCV